MSSPRAFPEVAATPEPEEAPRIISVSSTATSESSLTPSITVRRPTLDLDGWEPARQSPVPTNAQQHDWKPPQRTTSIHSSQGVSPILSGHVRSQSTGSVLESIPPPRSTSPSPPPLMTSSRSGSLNSTQSVQSPSPPSASSNQTIQSTQQANQRGRGHQKNDSYAFSMPLGTLKGKPSTGKTNILVTKNARPPSPAPSLSVAATLEKLERNGLPYAGTRRNAEFHALFPSLSTDELLVDDVACGYHSTIMVQGKLFMTPVHLCFHSSLWGATENKVICKWKDVKGLEKKYQGYFFANAIEIQRDPEPWFLGSFVRRDATYDLLMRVWESSKTESPTIDQVDEKVLVPESQCCCIEHEFQTLLSFTYSTPLNSIFSLLFGPESVDYLNDFFTNTRKYRDFKLEKQWDGAEAFPAELKEGMERNLYWIVPLNGPIGPKQTRNLVTETLVSYKLGKDGPNSTVVTIEGTNPDVPSGDAFSLVTRVCLTKLANNKGTRVKVGAKVVWTKSSWIKKLIESNALDGVKESWSILDRQIREKFPQTVPPEAEETSEEKEETPLTLSKVSNGVATASSTMGMILDFLKDLFEGADPMRVAAGVWMTTMWMMVYRIWGLTAQMSDRINKLEMKT
jgi:hypothetical protein